MFRDGRPCLLEDEWFRHLVLAAGGEKPTPLLAARDLVCRDLDSVVVVAKAQEFREGSTIKQPVLNRDVARAVAPAIDRDHAVAEVLRIAWLVKSDEEMAQIRSAYARRRAVCKTC